MTMMPTSMNKILKWKGSREMRKLEKKSRCPRCGSRLFFKRRNCKTMLRTDKHPEGIRPAPLCMTCGLAGPYDLAPKPFNEAAPVWNAEPVIEIDADPVSPIVNR